MNKRVTSKEQILEAAMTIAKAEGVDKLSIRKLAAGCQIAVGSVYNYYPNKESLVRAVAENFWNQIFLNQDKLYRQGMTFTAFLEQYYGFLYAKLSPYDRSWVRDLEDKIPMQETLRLFMRVLEEDEKISPAIWNMEFRPDNFCQYVFKNVMALLQTGETNCRFFIYLLYNFLYEK